jgi:hypothetical protein
MWIWGVFDAINVLLGKMYANHFEAVLRGYPCNSGLRPYASYISNARVICVAPVLFQDKGYRNSEIAVYALLADAERPHTLLQNPHVVTQMFH